MRHLRVDLDLCEGYGNCVFEAEDYFELDDDEDGQVRLVRETVDPGDEEMVELAVASCPVSALMLDRE
jgi:ferredoxin